MNFLIYLSIISLYVYYYYFLCIISFQYTEMSRTEKEKLVLNGMDAINSIAWNGIKFGVLFIRKLNCTLLWKNKLHTNSTYHHTKREQIKCANAVQRICSIWQSISTEQKEYFSTFVMMMIASNFDFM